MFAREPVLWNSVADTTTEHGETSYISNIARYPLTMLNSTAIKSLIDEQELITGCIDIALQLQPAGFDLSLREVHTFQGQGAVDFSNKERVIAKTVPLVPDAEDWFTLAPGCYMIVYNEIVHMPLNVAALARTRSSLLRNGAVVETAVWDPGYQGRSSSLLVVHNSHGIRLKKDARVAQLVFYNVQEVGKGYSGAFQRERIGSNMSSTDEKAG